MIQYLLKINGVLCVKHKSLASDKKSHKTRAYGADVVVFQPVVKTLFVDYYCGFIYKIFKRWECIYTRSERVVKLRVRVVRDIPAVVLVALVYRRFDYLGYCRLHIEGGFNAGFYHVNS